ncbi:MAG: hypothetical protein ACE5JI_05670 [Acidobacteriota bacterium]
MSGALPEPPRAPDTLRSSTRRFLWLATTAFLLHGNWEWLQSPFYDDRTTSIRTIVWYRFHCTLGDVLILLGCAVAVSLFCRGTEWLAAPRRRHLIFLSALGTAYTAGSEQVNVGLLQAWSYSALMPVIPGTFIGLVPLLQWVLLPPVAVSMATRLAR